MDGLAQKDLGRAGLFLRFSLSFRDVEGPLAERRIVVSYETIRRWVAAFVAGHDYASPRSTRLHHEVLDGRVEPLGQGIMAVDQGCRDPTGQPWNGDDQKRRTVAHPSSR
jgi:hypothetical protein